MTLVKATEMTSSLNGMLNTTTFNDLTQCVTGILEAMANSLIVNIEYFFR